jgi:bis(5'-nucleosyl)-tetraphosphatase (symmetrical)
MATYAIGDVQGCYDELQQLLKEISFAEKRDRLWFVGDLVNRGPKSLEVLRFVKGLGERAVTVLGNHDLHLVTQHEGFERPRKDDTLQDVLAAKDRKVLVDWLRTRPLMHVEGEWAMVHAGLVPKWSIERALALGKEAEAALAARGYREFLENMYGSKPERWSDDLEGWDRLRVIINAMTRMRFCTPDGTMDFKAKGEVPPAGFQPWFALRPKRDGTIVCGHWSAMGLKLRPGLAAIDTGCVWGGSLTALRLDDRKLYQVKSKGYQEAKRGD